MNRTFTIIDAEQRSAEWFAARLGRVTGSAAAAMFAKGRGSEEAAARRDLRTKLAIERLTGAPQEDEYQNDAMRRGVELEPEAFGAYEAAAGELLERTGFLSHDDLLIGCSLDGHVGDFDGIVELKCPKSATHLRYWRSGGGVPAEHKWQLVHNLYVSGAKWCDFASYDPRFPEPLRLFRARLFRSDAEMESYGLMLRAFLTEVDKEVEAVKALMQPAGAAA
jgi:putative phage-type endonuclease